MVGINEVSELLLDLLYTTDECLYIELTDILDENDIIVERIEDLDAHIYVYIFDDYGSGCLMIDKIRQEFSVEVQISNYFYPPIVGDLESVIKTYVRIRDEGKRLAENRRRLRPKN